MENLNLENGLKPYTKFTECLAYSRTATNKVAALVGLFQNTHEIGEEDQENQFGRMGRIWTLANKDTGFLLKVIWVTAADSIAGSHLNYIQAIIQRKNIQKPVDRSHDHAGMKTI